MDGRLASALVLAVALAACGTGGSGAPRPTAPSSSTAAASAPAGPTPTTRNSAGSATGSVTVRGTVSAGVEAGCLLLTPESRAAGPAGSGAWLLVGATAGLEAGSTATVRGRPAPGEATTCQQGTPFRVDAVVSP